MEKCFLYQQPTLELEGEFEYFQAYHLKSSDEAFQAGMYGAVCKLPQNLDRLKVQICFPWVSSLWKSMIILGGGVIEGCYFLDI